MNLKSQLAISQPFLVIVVFKQPENVCIMFDKRVEDLESVILELEKKYKLRKTDKVPTWGLVKKIFEGTLREHMWDILVMNAEYNMSTNKTNFSIHERQSLHMDWHSIHEHGEALKKRKSGDLKDHRKGCYAMVG